LEGPRRGKKKKKKDPGMDERKGTRGLQKNKNHSTKCSGVKKRKGKLGSKGSRRPFIGKHQRRARGLGKRKGGLGSPAACGGKKKRGTEPAVRTLKNASGKRAVGWSKRKKRREGHTRTATRKKKKQPGRCLFG